MYQSRYIESTYRRREVGTDGQAGRRARVRRPRPAARVPAARLRAAQAAQRDPRRLPGLLLRLALPLPQGAAGRRLDRRGQRRAAAPPTGKRRGSSTSSPPRARSTSHELLAETGPSAWEDETFGVHFAFFGRTDAETRLRILEGRRSRLEERLDGFRAALARTRERLDSYTLELQQHGLESVEREVRWLTELIDDERRSASHQHEPGNVPGPRPVPGRRPDTGTTENTEKEHRMGSVRVAIVGVGNCAASLVQGVEYYQDADPQSRVPGLMHVQFGDYHVRDVEFVAAFDVDAKKVGQDLSEAIVASENNTIKIADVPPTGITVQRGHTLDGLGKYYRETINESDDEPVDVVQALRETQGRRPRLLPAGRLRGRREVLRAVRHRRRGRLRQRAAGLHRRHPGVGRRSSTPPVCRSSATTSSPRSARPSRTACWPSCSRTAA